MSNILLVANWPSDVGYAWWLMESFWAAIASHFSPQGRKTVLIYPRVGNIPSAIANAPIEVLEHDFDDWSAAGRRHLRQIIRSRRISAAYLTDRPYLTWRNAWLRQQGVHRIIVHDHTPGDRTRPGWLKRAAKTLANRAPLVTADRCIAVTEFVRQRQIVVGCVPPEKVAVAPNGIEPIGRDPKLADYARNEFDIPAGMVIMTCAARASPYKGIDFILSCVHALVRERGHDNVCFVFCGDGPALDGLKELALSLGITDHVRFAGRRNDVSKILQSSHIGIQASLGEVGYSLSILEYMSAGLATVVPDLPSTREATRDGVTGLLYRHQDLVSAVNILERLLIDAPFREGLGRQAMHAVEHEFSLKNTHSHLLDILQSTLESG